jgi:hypothetical protein
MEPSRRGAIVVTSVHRRLSEVIGMRSVRVLFVGAVVAAAVAVPAIAAGGGSATSTPATPQPRLCQSTAAKELNLSAAQASAVRSACDAFKSAAAAADRAYAAKVEKLAVIDRAGLWRARQERRTAVWAARDKLRATVHGRLGIARQNLGAGRSVGRGPSVDVRGRLGFGRMGGAASGRGQRPGMGGQGQCPYAQS